MIVDNRSISEIKNDIGRRMIMLGRVIIMKKISIFCFMFTFIMSLYNFITWMMKGAGINPRCFMGIMWLGIAIIFLLLFNTLQGFGLSLKQNIYNDKIKLSKI